MTNSSYFFTVAFVIFNVARIYLYKDVFTKLIKSQTNLDTHSLIMWVSWILGNVFAVMKFQLNTTGVSLEIIISVVNTLCIVATTLYIAYKRIKFRGISERKVIKHG